MIWATLACNCLQAILGHLPSVADQYSSPLQANIFCACTFASRSLRHLSRGTMLPRGLPRTSFCIAHTFFRLSSHGAAISLGGWQCIALAVPARAHTHTLTPQANALCHLQSCLSTAENGLFPSYEPCSSTKLGFPVLQNTVLLWRYTLLWVYSRIGFACMYM